MTKQVGDSTRIDTWAATGQKTEPLEAKKNLGWEVGERPANDFMNFIQNQFGQKINHILANGVPAWNALDNYEANAFASRDGIIYKAVTPNTASQPPSVNWEPILTQATLDAAGVTRYASDLETQTGTAANRAVTPASLSSRTATETRTGLSAEATANEVLAGLITGKFVSPQKLLNTFFQQLTFNGNDTNGTYGFRIGALIIQGGITAPIGDAQSIDVTLQTSYTQYYFAYASLNVDITGDATTQRNVAARRVSNSIVRIQHNSSANVSSSVVWFTIGR